MSNIPAYPLGNFQERQKLQCRLLGWLPWKQTVLETRPFPLNEKLFHCRAPLLSASCQQLLCSRCPLGAEAGAQRAEGAGGRCSGTGHCGWHRAVPFLRVCHSTWHWTQHRIPAGQPQEWPEKLLCPGILASPTGLQVQKCRTEHRVLPVHPALLPCTPNPICSQPKVSIF